MAHLFLSHSSADDGFVRELREALADLDQEVWIDSRQLKGGDPLWSAIQAAIEAAAGLAVLVSPDAFQSDWVARELKHGLKVQAERGLAAFPVFLLALNGTKPGSLAGYFDEKPIDIPVSSAPGGATAATHNILVALGKRLPTEWPSVAQPRPVPVEELVLKLSDLRFYEENGKRRAAGNAQLIYEPATPGQRAVESSRWRLISPLGPIEAEALSWYLERWPVWPSPEDAVRAKEVEANLPAWGQALHAVAMPPEHTACVLQDWGRVAEQASRHFSVAVDSSLVDGAPEHEVNDAKEAATALLALPWELLNTGDAYLFQGARPTCVRRRLPNRRSLPVSVVATPIRVLLITARPEDENCIYRDHRASATPLVQATEELGDLLELRLLHPPTYSALEAELAHAQQSGKPYHVLHFDGHGVYSRRLGLGGLCFEDPRDISKLTGRRHDKVFTDRLGPLLSGYRIPLMILATTQAVVVGNEPNLVPSEILERGVASVISMNYSILEESAGRFVSSFYGALADGKRTGEAMLQCQRALFSDPSRRPLHGEGNLYLFDWFVPVLFQEKDDGQLFKAIPSPQAKEGFRARLNARLGDVPVEPGGFGFVGRSKDLLSLERLLRQERWAVLRGQGGEGKTALAAELARWQVRSQQVERAAFVSMELYRQRADLLDALGHQLVGADYSAVNFESPEQALQPIERALREQATLLVLDNMESVLLPPYRDMPELVAEGAAVEIQSILQLAQRLLQVGETRIVFTSREQLPQPFNVNRNLLELLQLERSDAVELIKISLVDIDSTGVSADMLEFQRQEIEALAEAVHGHARTLALLGPELRRSGVAATQAALIELMEQMQRQVADLPAEDPRRREQSLFASVELSLRRLSTENRERVRVLGVFHGVVDLDALRAMTGWEPAEVQGLAQELVGTGLATPNPHNHLALNPALCPYLKASLSEEELQALTAGWLEAMATYLRYLDQQQSQNTELTATLTLLELPNLLALLDRSKSVADPETMIDRATSLYSLLRNLDKPQLLDRVARVREAAAAALGEDFSHARFQASRTRIEQQLAAGQLREALAGAQQLLQQAQAAGQEAYVGAGYDLAMAFWLRGRVLKTGGGAQQALPLLQEASLRFEAIAIASNNKAAAVMASKCIVEQGDCLRDLGRYDAASAAYEEAIRRGEQRGDLRDVAVGKGQLGTVRLEQQRFTEALEAHQQARDTFSRLNKPDSVAVAWHQIGRVHEKAGQPEAAEEAYRQSLAIEVRLGNQAGQARTLGQVGTLYNDVLQRPEEAVALYRRAAEIYREIGNLASEGIVRNNLANTLVKLQRLDEARQAIRRAIDCKAPFGHAAEPWTSWAIFANIETAAGSSAAADDARHQALGAFLAYRRDGGENQSRSGRLALSVRQALASGDPAEAASSLQQLAADPDFANQLPFLTALQAITAGSRDRSLAEDPGLTYDQAAEVLLLIEALEAEAGG